ncbi:pilus assembly protein [Robbsia sp. Bb-Pol-6]|uniref:Pilus assembly protein n=1 Tax=Robbsia betulipollinis TaxID=2981849 RepID=A0ABT3ZNN6_9BURK|nr:pilus assembly protein [Robbsia betulipollinis]
MTGRAATGRARPARASQRGTAAIEFALVFPTVFLLVYGLITYGLILLAQQSLQLAVAEGARAALRYSTAPALAACNAVNLQTAWLGSNLAGCPANAPVVIACPYQSSASCLKVVATYPYAANPLVPTLPLLNLLLPTTLSASAVVQLEPGVVTVRP